MTVTIVDAANDLAGMLVARVQTALQRRTDAVLGLPAGHTPIAAYAELRRLCAEGLVNFSRASVFAVDEFVGISPSDPSSFRQFLERHLLSGLNVTPERIHSMDGTAPDPELECRRYEAAIRAVNGITLQILGIGANGHIGFNEPGGYLVARTHLVRLQPGTRRDNAYLFDGDISRVPVDALTMGIGTILEAEEIVVAASGGAKADRVERMVNGPVTTALPASLLQLHQRVEVILDRAAAARL